ncbi:uncharacterized protein FA14DRAFT_170048 [Meira miltonrushii]|uniref:Uncharacterized protein n=1 Tax=Meira miltonrushii TaxID=1280837 RepID=A0A316VIW3_9BASI|nr:uncharacterized protein FA14DRAFT_170048 [Meira miltonrushii]PWN37164.1 hypothetical protein FA14DRAFT_170048 [Meira miltonrushii]
MSSPRHSPPPSAAAPKPRGILKNASNGIAHSDGNEVESPPLINAQTQNIENANHLAWDESNLTLHEIQREQQDPRMKIDEPKTPFVRSASLGPMDDDTNFDLDNNQQAASNYFPTNNTAEPSSSSLPHNPVRRSSAAEVLAANTKANAGNTVGRQSNPSAAVGLDSADMLKSRDSTPASSRRGTDSRSPSFTLPNSRRSSAAGERSREGVRQEMRDRNPDAMDVEDGAFEEEEDKSEEAKAKQDAFARKRNAHYGNEAEAMKIAAALAAKDDDLDADDDDEDGHSSQPPMPNGRT